MNSLAGRGPGGEQVDGIEVDGGLVRDKNGIADFLNKYFIEAPLSLVHSAGVNFTLMSDSVPCLPLRLCSLVFS